MQQRLLPEVVSAAQRAHAVLARVALALRHHDGPAADDVELVSAVPLPNYSGAGREELLL